MPSDEIPAAFADQARIFHFPRPILSSATPELWHTVEAAASSVTLSTGEVLFSQGDEGDALYIIEHGEIEISVLSADGRKLALDVMKDGEVFGEIALFGGNRTATAAALGATALLRARRRDVMAALRARPELAFEFIELLCDRLRWVSGQLGQRAFLPVPVRLAIRLLYLGDKVGTADGTVPVSQADLADFVGSTREAVARTIGTWRARGWVTPSRGAIRVLDRDALSEIATSFGE